MLSKSASPLSKIDITVKVFCLGILPIIVSIPLEDIIVISSPISRFRVKLSSFPIEIKFLLKLFLLPKKFLFFTNSNLEKSSFA